MELFDFLQPMLLSLLKYVLLFILAYGLTWLSFPFIKQLIIQAEIVKPNYKGDKIPACAGLIFMALLPLVTALNMVFSVNSLNDSLLFLFGIIGMGTMGLIDDFMGNHQSKGFKGHFVALLKARQLTSGGFKALFGATIALVFCIGAGLSTKPSWLLPFTILLNFLLVCFTTNLVNLFDLRPGRAGKIYLFVFLIIVAFSRNLENYLGLFLPIVAITLYYLPFDLKSEVMMGDVGSNLLGASLGIMIVWMFNDISKIIALVLLIFLQLSAEKVSFTKVIERFSFLRYIDEIGRRRP